MIDVHAHILPNVDDGSDDTLTSLDMLREAEKQGVTDIVLTPHHRVDFRTKKEVLLSAFADFKAKAADAGITTKLYLGQEIYAFEHLGNEIANGKYLPLNSENGGKYVLLEFSSTRESEIVETAYDVSVHGFIPVIAHIERYPYADLNVAAEVKDMGGLIQVNAGAVTGDGGKFFKKKVLSYLKADLVDLVASDIHSFRPNRMFDAYRFVAKKFGTERAERLFYLNALPIIGKQA